MSESLSIHGGAMLNGSVRVSGAKNSALPLIIATLLTQEECRLANVPDLEDIAVMQRLIRSLGASAVFENNQLCVRTKTIATPEAPYALVRALRASFWVLGPLLARCGEARVSLPGGDAIGTRPVDLHLKGLVQMGADVRMDHGVVVASVPGGLSGKHIVLDYPSVGATHHLLMTAALIAGETVIEGAAREPEVSDLCALLSSMGAKIEGAGSPKIRIVGQRELGGASHEVLGDRIEAATLLLSGVLTGGRVRVSGIRPEMLRAMLDICEQAGCALATTDESITLTASERLKAVNFETAPYPGLATDVQPLLMAALSLARGESRIAETVFESRFGHVAEYRRFGADIAVEDRTAVVRGIDCLSGAPVEALDIRAAAGLVLMGLMASGVTDISDIHHLDRGYEALEQKLVGLGADIRRVQGFEKKEVIYGC